MPFRVYRGPHGSETTSPLDKGALLFKQFDRLDQALSWAKHINASGRVALFIEGDDGTSLDKRDIANALYSEHEASD
jgi:hypothetical protein